LSVEWLATRDAIRAAQSAQAEATRPARILLICASPRNDKTCPGEISKSFRLLQAARDMMAQGGNECDVLDLSLLTSEYGRVIYPCKACVSTAMPLCHWPCSCYPNHSLGQVNDWMNEIYPRWAAAHGILIITPVHWFQAPSTLKLMLDRLVCADGGNPDPTTTQGKDPELAKRIELDGWNYPRHLAGRAFAVVVHGDVEGATALRRSLVDWLTSMRLVLAGNAAAIDRYIGYYEPYAISHEALDRDTALFEEVRNAARALVNEVALQRGGRIEADASLKTPRDK
jgi:multimeric flavodoxin WrbA